MSEFTQKLILALIPLVFGSIAVPFYLNWKSRREKIRDEQRSSHEKELEEQRLASEKKLAEEKLIKTEEFNRQQEQREIRRQYFRSLLDRVNSENKNVKKCRRLIRAAREEEDGKTRIKLPEYIRLMEILEDSQLEFESLKLEMEIPIFNPPPELKNNFEKLEKYLSQVLKRFETGNYPAETVSIPLDSDPGTSEFIYHYKSNEKINAPFFNKYVEPLK